MTLFESADRIGGQLNMARVIPGKEEFHGLVDWYAGEVARAGIDLRLGAPATAEALDGFDEVVIASGVSPRDPGIPVEDGANVAGYVEILTGAKSAGDRVAIVGAGGIGFDVATFLAEEGKSPAEDLAAWLREWGVADPEAARGGLAPDGPEPAPPRRRVTLLQRKEGRPGRGLGKTTGWIHRASLRMKGVEMIGGVTYERISPQGLHVSFGPGRERPTLIPADTVVICAGQEPRRALADALVARGRTPHVIGGADVAAELDAKRAINQGARLAAAL